MATFEKKVSDIFHHETDLIKNFKKIIPVLFQETEKSFIKRMDKAYDENTPPPELTTLYDIAFMDYFYDELDDWFMAWVVEHYSDTFTAKELEEMEAQATSFLDYYQVEDVKPGKGSLIRSIHRNEQLFLSDISTSEKLTKWDIMLVRVYPFRKKYYATGAFPLFPADSHHFIKRRLEEEFNKYSLEYDDYEYAHFAKDCWQVFFKIEHEFREEQQQQRIFTPFGEYDPKDVIFKVNDLTSALTRIESLEEFTFSDQIEKPDRKNKQQRMWQYHYDWLSCGQDQELEPLRVNTVDGLVFQTHQLDVDGNQTGIQVIGNLHIDPHIARITVMSAELADYAKKRLPPLLGDTIKFKRITKAQVEPPQESQESELDEQTILNIERQFFEQYETDLLDTKVPMLNNLTPREARNDPQALPLLVEWLRHFENMAARKKQAGEMTIDIERLKAALNIET